MGKSNIDPIIQNKLQNFKSQLDKEELWNAINGSIPAPTIVAPVATTSSTALVVKGTSLAILLSLTLGMGYYLLSSQETETTHITETNLQEKTLNGDNYSTAIVTTTNEDENTPTATEESILESNSQTLDNTLNTSKKETPTINQTSFVDSEYKAKSNKFTQSEEAPATVVAAALKSESVQNNQTVTQSNQREVRSNSNITNQVGVAKTLNNTNNQILTSASTLKISDLLPLDRKDDNVEISLNHLSPFKDKVSCYDYSSKKPKLSIIGYYGPGMSFRSLEANDTEMTNYQSAREESEVMLENHRAGLQLKASHKSGIYGKAGIEVSVINEKFSQYTETTRSEIQYGLIETITLPDGTIEEVYGDREVTIISRKEWKNYNKFETIDLTAILGYEALINKFSYHVEAGVIYNLGTRFNGTFLDATTLQPHEVPSNYYKSKTGIDLHFAAGIGYDITKDITLTLSPSVRYDLKLVNESTYPLDQKYLMTSLLAGAEYRF